MKAVATLFKIIAVLLSDIMCIVVSYAYCDMKWGAKYGLYSAPAELAFVYIIPFAVGIIACLVLAAVFTKKNNQRCVR